MRSMTPEYLDSLQFNAKQLETLTRIGSFKGQQVLYGEQLPEVLKTMRKIAQVESAESSNRIEGISAPRKRIQGIVLENTNPTNRSEQEIAGYRDALEVIHESAMEMEFSPNVIKQLHSMMYRYLPQPGGTWKPVDNEIVERQPSGELSVRFRPVPAVATPQAITRKFGVGMGENSCLLSRDSVLQARRSAVTASHPPPRMNAVAMALGIHEGSHDPNRARKPSPMPIAANAVRIQPAKVRSIAMMLRSSARSVRNSAHWVLLSASSGGSSCAMGVEPSAAASDGKSSQG